MFPASGFTLSADEIRYRNDPVFHQIVDALAAMLETRMANSVDLAAALRMAVQLDELRRLEAIEKKLATVAAFISKPFLGESNETVS